jgi:alpha-mannosidase
MKQAVR